MLEIFNQLCTKVNAHSLTRGDVVVRKDGRGWWAAHLVTNVKPLGRDWRGNAYVLISLSGIKNPMRGGIDALCYGANDPLWRVLGARSATGQIH